MTLLMTAGEFDLGVETSPLGLLTDWLPAAEILGEGIFVQLDEKAVRAWEARKPDMYVNFYYDLAFADAIDAGMCF